ncbi:MAG: Beta-glucosidase [Polyangiaceae bacterium]|nr:Beta-glucosidase [Polyangiaceae bacterium]
MHFRPRLVAFALASGATAGVLVSACSHPAAPGPGTGTGTSGSNTGNGGTGAQNTGGAAPAAGTSAGGIAGSGGSEVVLGGSSSMGGNPPAMACADAVYMDPYTPGYTAPADPMVQTVLNGMSLQQKAAQMQGTPPGTASSKNYDDIQRSPDDTTANIRGYQYRDAGRGLNLDARQEGRPYMNNYSTAFPSASARGASFDLDLEYRLGAAMGDETTASQNTMLLAPCMNILRHPYWGRSQETYGEDVYHLGRMSSAMTAGIQQYIAACAKHYAGNNIENGRANNNAQMDEQTLREIYGRHFEMVVKDGGVSCVMASYNSVNGIKATQNKHLLTDILRNDFGFRGVVLSDWWAMPGDQNFPSASVAQSNATGAVKAGLDIEVPWILNFAQLQAAVTAGDLTQADINASAARILEQKFRFKSALLNGPIGLKTPTSTMTQGSITNNMAHIDLAREAAVKSMVLLKNDNNNLPIKTDGSIKSIAVVGLKVPYTLQSTTPLSGTIDFAVDQPIGDRGSSRVNPDPAQVVGPAAGITQAAMKHTITVTSGNTAQAAANADFVVVMVGLTPGDEGEEYAIPAGGDRASLTLPAQQDMLISEVAALGKPMVVVIQSGGIVNMPWLATVPSVVMAFYPGMRGGQALGQLLFGEANFGGRLPVAWPNEADLPPFKDTATTTTMDYFLGYRYLDKNNKTPIYPFGHGLSYTNFTFSNLNIPCTDVTKNGVVNVTVDIQNNTAVAGDTTAFLFVSYPGTTARRSVKELKGFYRVSLEGNQGKRVTIPLRISDLKYWKGDATGAWEVETGNVNIMVGPDAGHLELMGTLPVK